MSTTLKGKKIAILATDGFEQVELTQPKQDLEAEGAEVTVISLDTTPNEIRGWDMTDWGATVKVDRLVSNATPKEFHALLLPGGVISPDKLRIDKVAVQFVKEFVASGKLVAAICHAPWTLIEADVVRGKNMTSWQSLRTDLTNAGAAWVDEQVVVDGQFITSRSPKDLPAFSRQIIRALAT